MLDSGQTEKKGDAGEKQRQEHAQNFPSHHKEFVLAGQIVTSAYYCDYIKMCEDFTLNSGNKRAGCCITTMHHLTLPFSPGIFFYQNQHDLLPAHPTFLCFPD
jgi:hypothetical protein